MWPVTVYEMTYYVSSGMLNSAVPIPVYQRHELVSGRAAAAFFAKIWSQPGSDVYCWGHRSVEMNTGVSHSRRLIGYVTVVMEKWYNFNIYISQGSGITHLRCYGKYKAFIENSLPSPTM